MKKAVQRLLAVVMTLVMFFDAAPSAVIAEALPTEEQSALEQRTQEIKTPIVTDVSVGRQMGICPPEEPLQDEAHALTEGEYFVTPVEDPSELLALIDSQQQAKRSAKGMLRTMKAAPKNNSLQVVSCVAYDIELTEEAAAAKEYSVTVPVDVDMLKDYRIPRQDFDISKTSYQLYHIHTEEDGTVSVEELEVDVTGEDGWINDFTFTVDSFSSFVLKYTVDFTYRIRSAEISVHFENKESGDAWPHIAYNDTLHFTELSVAGILADAPFSADDSPLEEEVYTIRLDGNTEKDDFDDAFFADAAVEVIGSGVSYQDGMIRLTGDVGEASVVFVTDWKILQVEIRNYVAPVIIPQGTDAFTYRFFGIGEKAAVADILADCGILASCYASAEVSDPEKVTAEEEILTAEAYFDEVKLTVVFSDGAEVGIKLTNPASIAAGTVISTEGVGSFTAKEAVPAGTYLVVDTEPETPEGLTLDSGVNADGLVESEPVFFGVTLIGPDGKPVNTGAEVTIATRIPLPAEEGKITKVKEVKVYHIGEQGEAEPLEGVSYSLAEGVISGVTFTTPRFSLFAVTYTVEYIEKDKTYAIVGGGVISLRELLEALGVQQIQTEEIENVAFSNEELVKVVQVDEDTTAGELKRKLELSPSYSAELTEKDIAAMDALPLTAPDWALISLAPFKTDEKLIITLTDGQQYEIAVTDGQIVRYYIDAKGDTYEITVTFEDEANIPSTAELDVEEILPENEEYADYLAQALEALGGLEPAADQFARFFDITILDAGEKVTPKAPVTVSIRLADAPAGEELKVVHFDEADGPVVMQTEAVENGENENTENAYVWFETESFSVYGVIVAPSRPSGVNDLDGQMCTISHTKNNKTHYIKSTVLDEQVDKLDKTENQSEASVWQFEFAGVAGQYYISTIVDGVKQYMHLDQVDENNAHGTLSDTPQQFTIKDVGNGLYRLYVVIGDQTYYYLNEFNGGNGFAGWHIPSDADDKMALNFTSNPTLKDVEQYMLITQYEGEYYIVLNDGRLEKAESISGNPLSGEFTTPMTWTWDGSHLFHNSLAVGYTGDQRASDYYRRYIDPSAATGLSQEHATPFMSPWNLRVSRTRRCPIAALRCTIRASAYRRKLNSRSTAAAIIWAWSGTPTGICGFRARRARARRQTSGSRM